MAGTKFVFSRTKTVSEGQEVGRARAPVLLVVVVVANANANVVVVVCRWFAENVSEFFRFLFERWSEKNGDFAELNFFFFIESCDSFNSVGKFQRPFLQRPFLGNL